MKCPPLLSVCFFCRRRTASVGIGDDGTHSMFHRGFTGYLRQPFGLLFLANQLRLPLPLRNDCGKHLDEFGVINMLSEAACPDQARIKTEYFYVMVDGVEILRKTKYFLGNYEIEIDDAGNERKLHYLIAGDGIFAIVEKKNEGNAQIHYIHKNYLGSFDAITNSSGAIEELLSFDPWGRRRNPSSGIVDDGIYSMFDRGFTGHQHLDEFGLINMNGRLYDPVLARFLSPDPYLQAPDNLQNHNRYSYALNNPLIYTDPSGEVIWFVPIIFAAINVGVDLLLSNGGMNFGEIVMSAGMGAIGGFLSGPGITSAGKAFLSAGISQVNRLLPSVPIYQSDQFNLSVSPMVGFGSSGFNFGGSLNVSGQIDDFVYYTSIGTGYNSGVSSLGEGAGGSGFLNGGVFAGWNDGLANYGAGYSYNSFGGKTAQGVGAITAQVGDFSLRFDEDYIGDGMDRYRTGGLLATYKVNSDYILAFGGSMMTGMARGAIPGGNPGAVGGFGLYTNEDIKLRGGTMYGGVIYKGQSYFAGHNSEKRLHSIQNWIHRNVTKTSPYFPDFGFRPKMYSYYGGYHPYYLYY